jgi:hypothetical protein
MIPFSVTKLLTEQKSVTFANRVVLTIKESKAQAAPVRVRAAPAPAVSAAATAAAGTKIVVANLQESVSQQDMKVLETFTCFVLLCFAL